MRTESFRVLSRRVINLVSSINKAVPYRKVAYVEQCLKTDTITYEPTKGTVRRDRETGRIPFRARRRQSHPFHKCWLPCIHGHDGAHKGTIILKSRS